MSYRDVVIGDGASHYWRLGEPSGTVAADSVGATPGTISGGVTLGVAGPLADGSKAMTFDGTTGKIALTTLAFPVPVTLEAWVKLPGPDTNPHAILCNEQTGAVDLPLLFAAFGGFAVVNIFGGGNATGLVRIDNNVWHHVVAINDGSVTKLYVDGVADAGSQAMVRATPSSHAGAIGWNAASPTVFWKGSLAEVAVYATALTPAQIANHYALRTATLVLAGSYPAQVVADGASHYWRLDAVSGTLAADSIGSAPGTIAGAVALGQPGALATANAAMGFTPPTGQIQTATLSLPIVCTIEAWINIDPARGGEHMVFSTRGLVTGQDFVLYVHSLGGAAPNAVSLYGNTVSDGRIDVKDGRWHHVVCVLNGTTAALYHDGVLETETAQARAAGNTGQALIGADQSNGAWMYGLIDEVAVYPLALTPAQIASHYALQSVATTTYPAQVQADGASYYWRLSETSGLVAADRVGGAPGTISGGVTLGVPGPLTEGTTAMQFNGTTGKILCAVGAVIFQDAFSIEMWVKGSKVGQVSVVSGRPESGFITLYILGQYGAGGAFFYPPSATGTLTISDGAWHHVVATMLPLGASNIYIDGVLDVTKPSAPQYGVTSGGQLSIGWDLTDSNGYTGVVAEVAIYPAVLAPAQVAQHYALRLATPPPPVVVSGVGQPVPWLAALVLPF